MINDERVLKYLKEELVEAVTQVLKNSANGDLANRDQSLEWIDEVEAKRILGYRSKTKMQELRNSGSIIFSKFGRKIKYNRKSLLGYIEKYKKTKPNNYGN